MLRLVLFIVLAMFVARAFWRVIDGVVEGLRGPRDASAQVPRRGVQMTRDPVCGTFVIPDHALSLPERGGRVYFCSSTCRDRYRARTA
jgi:YHS domain-containing protein